MEEGVMEGVPETIGAVLQQRIARLALSRMMEVFALIVDVHEAVGIELFKGRNTIGLRDCVRMMIGEWVPKWCS